MQNPKISVCIPTFNRADLIEQTLQSVVNQTVKPYEVIIIDNASTDNTYEIVEKYFKYGFKYIRNKKNIGMAGNLNKCIKYASADYFTFLPSDDLIAPTWYEEWTQVIKKYPSFFYTSPLTIVNGLLKPQWAIPIFSGSRFIEQPYVVKDFWDRFTPGVPPSAASIYHKRIFEKIPKFNVDEGSECDIRVAMNIFLNFDIYYLHKFLFVFRAHSVRSFDRKKEQKTQKIALTKLENFFSILKDVYKEKYRNDPSHRYFIQSHILLNLANINFYILKLRFNQIITSYRLAKKYFPDMFSYMSDWILFVRIHWYYAKRILSTGRFPKSVAKQLEWLLTMKK